MPVFGYKGFFVEPTRKDYMHASRNPNLDWNPTQDGFRTTEKHTTYDSDQGYSTCFSQAEIPSDAEDYGGGDEYDVNREVGYEHKDFVSCGYAYDGVSRNKYYDTPFYPPVYSQAMPVPVVSNGFPAHNSTTPLGCAMSSVPSLMVPTLYMDAQGTDSYRFGTPISQATYASPAPYAYGANPGFYSYHAPTPLQSFYGYGASAQFVPAVANPPQSLNGPSNMAWPIPSQVNNVPTQKSGKCSASGISLDILTGNMKEDPGVNHINRGDTQPNQTLQSLCTGLESMDIQGQSSKEKRANYVGDDFIKPLGCEQLLQSIYDTSWLLCGKMRDGVVAGPLDGKMLESAIEALLLCFSMDEYVDYWTMQTSDSFPSSQKTMEKQSFKPSSDSSKDLKASWKLPHDIPQACLESKNAVCDGRRMLAEAQNVRSYSTSTCSSEGICEEHGVSSKQSGSSSNDRLLSSGNEERETPTRSVVGSESRAPACNRLFRNKCHKVVDESGEKRDVEKPSSGLYIVESYLDKDQTEVSKLHNDPLGSTEGLINLRDGETKDVTNRFNNDLNPDCTIHPSNDVEEGVVGIDDWEYVCS